MFISDPESEAWIRLQRHLEKDENKIIIIIFFLACMNVEGQNRHFREVGFRVMKNEEWRMNHGCVFFTTFFTFHCPSGHETHSTRPWQKALVVYVRKRQNYNM